MSAWSAKNIPSFVPADRFSNAKTITRYAKEITNALTCAFALDAGLSLR